MRLQVKIIAAFLLLMVSHVLVAQKTEFHFKRKIKTAGGENWYSLTLPANIFHSINRDFSDLRIFQIKEKDTLEVPYIMGVMEDIVNEVAVELPMFNKSKKDGKLFFTFELGKGVSVSHLDLLFEETNFNGYVQLEGSPDQKSWYAIDTLQRILSIQNSDVDLRVTSIDFSMTNYRFLRLQIQADKSLTLTKASFKKIEKVIFPHTELVPQWTTRNDKKTKESVHELTLDQFQPINSIDIDALSKLDYYRPIFIDVLRDSTKTPKGWSYSYENIYSGYITSMSANRFSFPYTLASKVRITIRNADNQPLDIKSILAAGPEVRLTSLLPAGDSFLFYGNNTMAAPSYDLVHFKSKIPDHLLDASLEPEENLAHPMEKVSPLFESKLWLWAIMGVVIAVLGFFTLRMMKAKV